MKKINMVMLEVGPEEMIAALELVCKTLVAVKKHPAILETMPDNPQFLLVTALQHAQETFARQRGEAETEREPTPEEKQQSEEQTKEFLKRMMN